MPLTSLGDNNILAESKVANMASPNKIAANIITRNPNITYSVFMNNYFPWHHLIIVCTKMFSLFELTAYYNGEPFAEFPKVTENELSLGYMTYTVPL
jgi:hypothetical protein